MVDADGDPVSGATGLDSEIDAWSDGSAPDGFADCTAEATEIGSTGAYYLSLTAGEMNADYIVIQIKSAEAKTQWVLISTKPDVTLAAIKATTDNLPSAVKRNTALNNFEFLLVDSVDHVTPKTGRTVTATRSIDGGAFAACANSVSEVGSGVYQINLAAADLNGGVITFRFAASGADDRFVTILTKP